MLFFREWCDNEVGINVRQSISLIAELLPYSLYLRSYLFEKHELNLETQDEQFTQKLPWLNHSSANEFQYLQMIFNLVRKIRKMVYSQNYCAQYFYKLYFQRKSEIFPGFLCAVCLLLSRSVVTIYNDEQ